MPQEEYHKKQNSDESDSPFVFVCSEPQELPIRFPVKGDHKICKSNCFDFVDCIDGLIVFYLIDKLDQSVHTAAVKAMQRMAKLRADEEKHSYN